MYKGYPPSPHASSYIASCPTFRWTEGSSMGREIEREIEREREMWLSPPGFDPALRQMRRRRRRMRISATHTTHTTLTTAMGEGEGGLGREGGGGAGRKEGSMVAWLAGRERARRCPSLLSRLESMGLTH